jgi:hypothetical protein
MLWDWRNGAQAFVLLNKSGLEATPGEWQPSILIHRAKSPVKYRRLT